MVAVVVLLAILVTEMERNTYGAGLLVVARCQPKYRETLQEALFEVRRTTPSATALAAGQLMAMIRLMDRAPDTSARLLQWTESRMVTRLLWIANLAVGGNIFLPPFCPSAKE